MIQLTFHSSYTNATKVCGPYPAISIDSNGWIWASGPPSLKIAERTLDSCYVTRDSAGHRDGLFDTVKIETVDLRPLRSRAAQIGLGVTSIPPAVTIKEGGSSRC